MFYSEGVKHVAQGPGAHRWRVLFRPLGGFAKSLITLFFNKIHCSSWSSYSMPALQRWRGHLRQMVKVFLDLGIKKYYFCLLTKVEHLTVLRLFESIVLCRWS